MGYQYINIDDTWSNSLRVNGLLALVSKKWLNGIKAVVDEIHSLCLKMGEPSVLQTFYDITNLMTKVYMEIQELRPVPDFLYRKVMRL